MQFLFGTFWKFSTVDWWRRLRESWLVTLGVGCYSHWTDQARPPQLSLLLPRQKQQHGDNIKNDLCRHLNV